MTTDDPKQDGVEPVDNQAQATTPIPDYEAGRRSITVRGGKTRFQMVEEGHFGTDRFILMDRIVGSR